MSPELPTGGFANGDLPVEVRKQAMWLHIAGIGSIAGAFLGLSLLSLVIPVIAWRSTRYKHPFVDENGRNATNFHISIAVYSTLFWLAVGLVVLSLCGAFYGAGSGSFLPRFGSDMSNMLFTGLGIVAMAFGVLQPIFSLIASIVGAVKAKRGQVYVYPLTLQFFKRR
jgi:uncharacterized protein